MSRAIIFANGSVPNLSTGRSGQRPKPVRQFIQADDILIAADGGTRHILALGLVPSVIIGDLDSLTVDDRQWMVEKGTRLIQYPADKDQTDLELALQYAAGAGHHEMIIVGALGGRLDQTLGNLSLLTGPEFAALDVRMDDGVEEAFFTRSRCEVRGRPADIVSLLPWGGEVTGVCTEGLRWPLRGETLFPDKTRGISNELLGESASISQESGLLLVVLHRNHKS